MRARIPAARRLLERSLAPRRAGRQRKRRAFELANEPEDMVGAAERLARIARRLFGREPFLQLVEHRAARAELAPEPIDQLRKGHDRIVEQRAAAAMAHQPVFDFACGRVERDYVIHRVIASITALRSASRSIQNILRRTPLVSRARRAQQIRRQFVNRAERLRRDGEAFQAHGSPGTHPIHATHPALSLA